MRNRTFLVWICTVLYASSGPMIAVEPHPFTVHDLVGMKRISEPAVSPDGKTVVFVLQETDLEADKGRKDLWLVNLDGSGLRRLTTHEANDFNPVWSGDGKSVYFLSSRSEPVQIWKIPTESREPEQITRLPLDIGMFKLSPQGDVFCLALDIFPGTSIEETANRLKESQKSRSSGVVYEQVMVRHWDSWCDGRRSHLFAVPVQGGDPVDVMNDMDADCPSKPFGGSEEVTFTPDGKGLVFSAKNAGREEAWSTNFDLYYVPVDGSRSPVKITDNPACDTHPLFSPDGKILACLSMEKPGYESDRFRIVLRPWQSGHAKPGTRLTEEWDRSPGSFFWAPNSRSIYMTADHFGQRALFGLDVRSGKIRAIVEKGTVRSAQMAGNTILFGMDHLESPVELFTVRPDGKSLNQLTRINRENLAAVKMGEPEQFSFKGWNDETVYVIVVKPVDFDPGRKYPVAFLIHGGPQGSFGNDFHYRWNPQAYAGAGFAAVMVDFHGSTGYGQAFTDAIRDDWGGKPLEDLQKGLAAALEKYPWMDGDRVAALGASYGGYMINWIAGNWPDRFRCLVDHDGNFDTRMAYFDTEELWFPEWDHAGTPWDKPEHFEKHNPANFVKNWKTPMLVIHGEHDYRVPITQGIATFNALQRRGIPSQFLYFPDESHWVLSPRNSIQWHDTVLNWLNRWCGNAE
jgi:dipeptidyl aminopeptidase/acylaminoacyl peptidase